VPVENLRAETMALAEKLLLKSPAAVKYTKEALRYVRGLSKDQALDYPT